MCFTKLACRSEHSAFSRSQLKAFQLGSLFLTFPAPPRPQSTKANNVLKYLVKYFNNFITQ